MLALEKTTTKQHLLLLSSSSSSHLTSTSLAQPSLAEKDGLEEAEVKNVRLDWICKNEGCWCGQSPSQRAGWHFTGVCLKEVTGGADRLKSLNVRLSTRSSPLVLKQHARRQCGSQHSAPASAVKPREYNAARIIIALTRAARHRTSPILFQTLHISWGQICKTELTTHAWIFHGVPRCAPAFMDSICWLLEQK